MLGGAKTGFRVFKAYRLYRKDFWGILLDKKQRRFRRCLYDIFKYKKKFYNKILSFVYGGKKIVAKRYSYGGNLFLTKQRFRLFYNNMKTAQVGDLLALARRRSGFNFYDNFFALLESRLDCLLVRSLFVSNFKQSRLFINRGVVLVNYVVVCKVGFFVKVGDVVSIKDLSELGCFFKFSFTKFLTVFDFVQYIYRYGRLCKEYVLFYRKFLRKLPLSFCKSGGFFISFLSFVRNYCVIVKLKKFFVRFVSKLIILLMLFGAYGSYLSNLFWLAKFRGGYYYRISLVSVYNYNRSRLFLISKLFKKPHERSIGKCLGRLAKSKSDFVGGFDEVFLERFSRKARRFVKFKSYMRVRQLDNNKNLNLPSLLWKNKLYFYFGYPSYMEVNYKVFKALLVRRPSFFSVPYLLLGLDSFRWVEFFKRHFYF